MKVSKENTDIFSNFFNNSFNNSIKLLTFPEILKHEDIKKGKKDIKRNYRLVSILQIYQRYLKNVRLNECYNFLRIYFRSINVCFGKVSVPSKVFWQC